MRIMYYATGKHTVMDGTDEYEFDNSDGSMTPNRKNSLIVSDSCGAYMVGKYPSQFKLVDDLPRPVFTPPPVTPGSGFQRLQPTQPFTRPASVPDVPKTPEIAAPESKIYPDEKKNLKKGRTADAK